MKTVMEMKQIKNRQVFLELVRLGMGHSSNPIPAQVDWNAIEVFAVQHWLYPIIVDGIDKLPIDQRPPKDVLLQWVGLAMQEENRYVVQRKTASDMAILFRRNYIRTYVLKGDVIAECYPKPRHRVSADMDCFLTVDSERFKVDNQFKSSRVQEVQDVDWSAWGLGNNLMKALGYEVCIDFYKNSTFYLPNLMVENHKFIVPFRGNRRLEELERFLQSRLKDDSLKFLDSSEDNSRKFEGTWLYRPPVMVSALFLIEHAYSHFLHEGLTWRHVLDWMMFSKKHKDEINWTEFESYIEKFGFRKFYDSYLRLGQYLLGETTEENLTKQDKMMLEDVWAPLDLHETTEGLRGKLALVGNTWRARWKYHYFADISMLHALWIQVKGFLLIKDPKLS